MKPVQPLNNLAIVQWNVRGVNPRMSELKNFVFTFKPDMCVQETWLKMKHSFNVTGYNIVRKDRAEGRGGGVAKLIKAGINYRLIDAPPNSECVIVELHCKTETLWVVNVYVAPGDEAVGWIETVFSASRTVITGDMNGYSPAWRSKKTNQNGLMIEKMIDKNNYVVLNTGEPTYEDGKGYTSVLDLSLATNDIASKCTWSVHDDSCGSDHMPCIS